MLTDLGNVRMAPDLDGGALMDVGCYCVSGARLLGGEPERVFGEQVLGSTGSTSTSTAPCASPATSSGSSTPPSRSRNGSGWRRWARRGRSCSKAPWRSDWGGRVLVDGEAVDVPAANPYALELSNLAAAIAGEAEPLLGRDDAVAQARVIEALYRSAESGEAVRP